MDGITLRRAPLLCTLLLWAFQGCRGTVTVKVPPYVNVVKDETATLPCTYSGKMSSNLVISWHAYHEGSKKRIAFKFGEEIKIDEAFNLGKRATMGADLSLTITKVQPSDELTYVCEATAGPEGYKDASTYLTVFYAPEAPKLEKPTDRAISVISKESSEIGTCVATNVLPQPRLIWFKNDQPIPEVKDKDKDTYMVPIVVKEPSGLYTLRNTLYMKPVKEDKNSVFFCKVEYRTPQNTTETKRSNTITINLNYPSEKTTFTFLNTSPIKEGDKVEMKCETDGNPQPDFEFSKDGKDINGEKGLLTLKSVNRTNSGEYVCKGLDYDAGDKDLTAKLNVVVHYMDPVVVKPLGSQTVSLGGKMEWKCDVNASDKHTLHWKKGSKTLSEDGNLILDNISYDQAGEYICEGAVPSVPGLKVNASVNLSVEGKPIIAEPAIGEVSKQGEQVTLKCVAHGEPKPQFTWVPSAKESVAIEGNMIVSTIVLNATADIMKNGVNCTVSNKFGKETKTLTVAIMDDRAIKGSAEVLLSGNPVLKSADMQQGGSSAVVVAVVVCVLLLLLLVGLIYCLNKRTKLPCSKKDKKDMALGDVNNDIVVEMKTGKTEQDGLLNKKAAEK
ncbi:Basal cell adhesion molecule [Oryzias melastigma]|uniref:Basal cell adhesion molecule n=1 Tax=Oryzias melastigma TaxID=30732 RepID=A0A834BYM3_ORYME|nr:Basal cell adhesion molecule [Oryzias melastigma]